MTDFAWLIEAPGQRYLATRHLGRDEFHWTQDAAKATRFCSEAQADGVMMAVRELAPDLFAFAANLGDAKPTEHGWLTAPKDEGWRTPEGWVLVPREPTEAMLKAAFGAMNETPSGTWKRMKAEGQTPRRLFDVKMAPRYRAMIAAAPTQSAGGTET